MSFFKQVLAVVVGILVSGVIVVTVLVIGLLALIGITSSFQEPKPLTDNTVLRITLSGSIQEKTEESPADILAFLFDDENEMPLGLIDIKEAIRNAQTDNNIKGILLDFNNVNTGSASLEEIRISLTEFKNTGKFILAYGEYMSESAYYLASIADEIYMHPEGILEFNGYSVESVFLKGMFDKLGVEPEIFRVGSYKSAIEPFLLDKMSSANKEQTLAYLNTLYDIYLQNIAQSRNKSVAELRQIADKMLVRSADDAVKYGLVTQTAYRDMVNDRIRELLQIDQEKKINFASLENYIALNSQPSSDFMQNNRIAVLVAEGEIVSSGNQQGQISAFQAVKQLRELRQDDKVRAIVLRINSPGGSALASDVIWREIHLTSAKKPVIASMSDVAASGGYYMAMACDTIVALPNTITGSIGIFAVMFNLQPFFKEKLGVTFDNVKTGEFADIANGLRPFTETERRIIQEQVERGYRTFTQKASQDRGLSLDSLLAIAQGRVWTGRQALQNGLVDVEGGIDVAIEIAANKAQINDYQVDYVTLRQSFWEKFKETAGLHLYNNKSMVWFNIEKKLQNLLNQQVMQARMPYYKVKL